MTFRHIINLTLPYNTLVCVTCYGNMSSFLSPRHVSCSTTTVHYKLFWYSGVLLSSYMLFSVATIRINFIIELLVFLKYSHFVYV